jgi:hypothetical protein
MVLFWSGVIATVFFTVASGFLHDTKPAFLGIGPTLLLAAAVAHYLAI